MKFIVIQGFLGCVAVGLFASFLVGLIIRKRPRLHSKKGMLSLAIGLSLYGVTWLFLYVFHVLPPFFLLLYILPFALGYGANSNVIFYLAIIGQAFLSSLFSWIFLHAWGSLGVSR